jgi:GNAT superfamily N-acetyltransferase
MPEIDRFQPADRRAVEALYRRVFGNDAADASRLRWDWQYRRNPNNPAGGSPIWVARESGTVIGQYATMPVRLWVNGHDVQASWGMDVMVAPERQRQGLGEILFRQWDREAGASLGLGLSPASQRLFTKLGWPDVGPVPCLVKPLTRRAVRRANWPMPVNRLVSAVTEPFIRIIARTRPMAAEPEPIRRFDGGFTALWERVAPRFDLAVRRDADYLTWKYVSPPHVRYSIVALRGPEGAARGYAVYRHVQEPRGRVTLLVDFLTDPQDEEAFEALLGWVDRAARAADSDKIRTFATGEAFRRIMRRSGYFLRKSSMGFVVKVNAIELPPDFYRDTSRWHVTLGDSDQDH